MADSILHEEPGMVPMPAAAGSGDALPSTVGADRSVRDQVGPQTAGEERLTVSPSASGATSFGPLPILFGAYELVAEIARGGMGIVYKARDLQLGRTVALKMLRGGAVPHPEDLSRFFREAQAAGQLQHPNIVPIHEVAQFQNSHYFTMAYIAGGSLAQQLDRFREPRSAAALMEKVARAVHHAHGHGILHRDLKPANILIDERGEPLVADFGLAKFVATDANLTRTGDFLGTPAYMAPEQAAGATWSISAQSDVWAMGVILYELLTGTRPFQALTAVELYRVIQESDPIPPRRLTRQLPQDLETIVLKCIEKQPSRRYASAAALSEDLAKWSRGEPILARPLSLLRRVGRRFKTRTARAVAGGIVIATIVAIVLMNQREPDTRLRPEPLPHEGSREELRVLHNDFAQQILAMKNDVAKASPVPLLLPNGHPRWYKILASQKDTSLTIHDGLLQITSGPRLAAIALLRDPPPDFNYIFHADVLHEQDLGQGDSDVGLFVLANDLSTQQGTEHDFFALTFRDHGSFLPRDDQGRVYSDVGFALRRNFDYGSHPRNRFVNSTWLKFPPHSGTWRHLSVRVTPTDFTAFWGDTKISNLTRSQVNQLATTIFNIDKIVAHQAPLEEQKGARDAIEKRGSGARAFQFQEFLGLYVHQAVATFRDVRIEPIKPEKE